MKGLGWRVYVLGLGSIVLNVHVRSKQQISCLQRLLALFASFFLSTRSLRPPRKDNNRFGFRGLGV